MTVVFSIEYFTRWGEDLFIHTAARCWPMRYTSDGIWTAEIDARELSACAADGGVVEYWYEVVRDGFSARREWRHHTLDLRRAAADAGALRKGRSADARRLEIRDSWSDIPGWKGAGTAVPVFSLRSADDFGIGEFRDLRKLVDWAAATGQSFIQLLPVNDTTMTGGWTDSYPYNANSAFALHPQFVNLEDAGLVPDEEYLSLREELNALPAVDYARVNELKDKYMRKVFDATSGAVLASKSYRAFVRENREWLLPYAAYRVLTAEHGTADFREWGPYSKYDAAAVSKFCARSKSAVAYHCFVQYHLDAQFRAVREYAHSKGVFLKGDLPIGVSPCSCDAWTRPELFNMDSQAGAPPDFFSADGQNWGFPTYCWEEMEKDGYAWWKSRLARMNRFFDAFRIDHILGFFRIWEIPRPQRSGIEGHFNPALPYSRKEILAMGLDLKHFVKDPRRRGYWHPRIDASAALGGLYEDFFYRRHNDFWKEGALRKLSALLGSTGMLACGEDLGMIPACVPEVMSRLGILSLEIQRMPKEFGARFGNPSAYPYASVCTTSTHDMTPLRAWWLEDREGAELYWREMLGETAPVPQECPVSACCRIVRSHLDSPAMLSIIPIQDWLALDEGLRYGGDPMDERINFPAVCPWFWRYRMHLRIEELLDADAFNDGILSLVRASGR